MAKGSVSRPSDSNQLPFREIALRVGILQGLLCETFEAELKKIEPRLNFSEGTLISYFGEKIVLLNSRSENLKKLFELDYLIGSDKEITLSEKGMDLRNKLDQALGNLETEPNTLHVLGELTRSVALRHVMH